MTLPAGPTRPAYSVQQLQQYFERVSLPAAEQDSPVLRSSDAAKTEEGLRFLSVLQTHHLAPVPFENLELHCSSHHTITLDTQHLFHKIVERRTNRGGYCMENSRLFGTVLHSRGYEVFAVGAKVNEAAQPMAASKNWKAPKYDGW